MGRRLRPRGSFKEAMTNPISSRWVTIMVERARLDPVPRQLLETTMADVEAAIKGAISLNECPIRMQIDFAKL
jgi:hypothetical protein